MCALWRAVRIFCTVIGACACVWCVVLSEDLPLRVFCLSPQGLCPPRASRLSGNIPSGVVLLTKGFNPLRGYILSGGSPSQRVSTGGSIISGSCHPGKCFKCIYNSPHRFWPRNDNLGVWFTGMEISSVLEGVTGFRVSGLVFRFWV